MACATLLLAACASTMPVPATVDAPGMPSPEAALQRSLRHVDAEMSQLGQLSPMAGRTATPLVPEDLQRVVSYTYSGALDEGVAKLAASIGYTFYTTRPDGAAPLPVSVALTSVPAYQAFQALGEQAGTRATVSVDPVRHHVQVIHRL